MPGRRPRLVDGAVLRPARVGADGRRVDERRNAGRRGRLEDARRAASTFVAYVTSRRARAGSARRGARRVGAAQQRRRSSRATSAVRQRVFGSAWPAGRRRRRRRSPRPRPRAPGRAGAAVPTLPRCSGDDHAHGQPASPHNGRAEPRARGGYSMAWDFSTEPEFQEQLDWMRQFVREEIWPLETIVARARPGSSSTASTRRCRRRSSAAGCGPRTSPDLGGQGFGQVKLGLMHEILGHARRSRRTRSATRRRTRATSEILALAGTRRAEGALAGPAARRRPQVGVLDDRARHRRLGPDAAADARGARRRRLGHQRPQVVLHQRVDRRLPDRHGGHRPRRAAAPARVDDHRPGRHARREHRARRRRRWSTRSRTRSASSAATPRSSTRTCASRPRTCSAARAPGFLIAQHRLGPGPHPPLHALAGRVAAAPSTCSASARCTARRAARCWPRSRRSRTGSPTPPRRCRRRG